MAMTTNTFDDSDITRTQTITLAQARLDPRIKRSGVCSLLKDLTYSSPEGALRGYGGVPALRSNQHYLSNGLIFSSNWERFTQYIGTRQRSGLPFGFGADEVREQLQQVWAYGVLLLKPTCYSIHSPPPDVSGNRPAGECPVCYNDISGGVLCPNKHSVCSTCYGAFSAPKKCPLCRISYSTPQGQLLRKEMVWDTPYVVNSFTSAQYADYLFLGWLKRAMAGIYNTTPSGYLILGRLNAWYDKRTDGGYGGLLLAHNDRGRTIDLDYMTHSSSWREYYDFIVSGTEWVNDAENDDDLKMWASSHTPAGECVRILDEILPAGNVGTWLARHREQYGENGSEQRLRKIYVYHKKIKVMTYPQFLEECYKTITLKVYSGHINHKTITE